LSALNLKKISFTGIDYDWSCLSLFFLVFLPDTRKGQPSPKNIVFSKAKGADPIFQPDHPIGPAIPGFAVSPSVSWRLI
jgi:hypothetical protein